MADRGEVAVHPVQGNTGSGIGAGLRWEVQDTIASLNMYGTRGEPVFFHPVHSGIELQELFLRVIHILPLLGVRHT